VQGRGRDIDLAINYHKIDRGGEGPKNGQSEVESKHRSGRNRGIGNYARTGKGGRCVAVALGGWSCEEKGRTFLR